MLKRFLKVSITMILIISLCFISVNLPAFEKVDKIFAAETETTNIGVDINGNENRNNLKSPDFDDWRLTGLVSPSSFSSGDVSFILSTSTGVSFSKGENKTLMSGDNKPYLTTDGAYVSSEGVSIILEISGLSEGTHTLTTWHSYFNKPVSEDPLGELAISINGEEKAVVKPTVQVTDDLDAGIAYVEFNAVEGETVTITVSEAADSSGYTPAVLNAFEIDGSHPRLVVKNIVPENNDGHHDPSLGLSWEAGIDAVMHDVYLGTDEYLVSTATTKSAEYKGRQAETSYAFTDELSHMEEYYWRVDEIDAAGNVAKGRVYHFSVRHLAFPSAEGYGRFAKGGRGGYVYQVTNLNDSGLGSLRYGIETLKGARIIVFNVGGVISLESRLTIPADGGNVYIAGQTAPGDGITLINYGLGALGAEDVIIRNVRVRVGDVNGKATDGMGMATCDHSIIDHCSISWATEEGFSSRFARNITFQNNIIAESLNNSVYSSDASVRHGFAASVGGNIASFHHNLITSCTGRNWYMASSLESDGKTYAGYLDIRNNVVYNWQSRTTDGGARRVNFVGNYYKMGPESRNMDIFSIDGDELNIGDCQQAYLEGNKMVDIDGSVLLDPVFHDPWAKASVVDEDVKDVSKLTEAFCDSYITEHTADEAYESVLANVGAVVPRRDYLDERYIEEVRACTYTYKGSKDGYCGIIDSQEDVGGYPNETNFNCGNGASDIDCDGMPDEWEEKHNLNPNNAADGSEITLSAEGYTNVEMYLNELMGDVLVWADGSITNTPAPATPEPTATPSPDAPVIEVGNVKAKAGETVQIPISLKNNSGITAIALDVEYDSEVMSLKSVTNNNLLSGAMFTTSPRTDINPYKMVWLLGTANITSDGVLAVLEFEVKEDAVEGEYPLTVKYEEEDIYNTALENVNFYIQNGILEVKNTLPGDVNGDEKINTKDAALILQYFVGMLDSIDEDAADVNNDGKINTKDAALILQYFAGWDVVLG